MSFRDDFERLCLSAKLADDHGSGSTDEFEPQMIAILAHCEQEIAKGNEQEVVAALVAVGKGEIAAPYETLMFCLHKLRLHQVLDEMWSYQQSLDPNSRRSHDCKFGYLPHIVASLNDDWDGADLWTVYRKPIEHAEPDADIDLVSPAAPPAEMGVA